MSSIGFCLEVDLDIGGLVGKGISGFGGLGMVF